MNKLFLKPWDVEHVADRMNGAPVHLFKKKGSPIYIRVLLDAGARYDGKEGTAHFVEHMLVTGTKKFPKKDLLAEYIEECGGQFSLWTDSDHIRIDIEIAKAEDFGRALTIIDEIYNNAKFSEATFRNEKKVICTEYQTMKSNPKDFIKEVYRHLFFQDTPIGRSVIGSVESVKSINLEDLRIFEDKNLNTQCAAVIVAGDIDMDIVTTGLKKILDSKTGEKKRIRKGELALLHKKFYEIARYDTDQVQLIVGFRTAAFNLREKIALDLLATLLGTGRSSVLLSELRYKHGLVYGLSCANNMYLDRGTWTVRTSCNIQVLVTTLNAMIKQLKLAASTSFFKGKLPYLKSKLAKSTIIKLQTSKSWVDLNQPGLLSGENITIDDYFRTLDNITIGDINKVAKKYFTSERFYIAACGPKESERMISAVRFE